MKLRQNTHRNGFLFAPFCNTLSEARSSLLTQMTVVKPDSFNGVPWLEALVAYEAEGHVLILELNGELQGVFAIGHGGE